MMEWISVEERLPEDDYTDVLAWNGRLARVAYIHETEGWCYSETCYPRSDVTHWMPLPEPPTQQPEE